MSLDETIRIARRLVRDDRTPNTDAGFANAWTSLYATEEGHYFHCNVIRRIGDAGAVPTILISPTNRVTAMSAYERLRLDGIAPLCAFPDDYTNKKKPIHCLAVGNHPASEENGCFSESLFLSRTPNGKFFYEIIQHFLHITQIGDCDASHYSYRGIRPLDIDEAKTMYHGLNNKFIPENEAFTSLGRVPSRFLVRLRKNTGKRGKKMGRKSKRTIKLAAVPSDGDNKQQGVPGTRKTCPACNSTEIFSGGGAPGASATICLTCGHVLGP